MRRGILSAPRNDWNMRSDSNWWGYVGGATTPSGVRVSEDIAMTFSAWFSGVRIISETLATLPCQLVEHVGNRAVRQADDHPLYNLFIDQPNPEQDQMGWFDMQTAFMVNWGGAFAEKQRDTTGRVVALWPIHPSRIPLRNIRRNGIGPDAWAEIEAGQPGEIIYWVNNDDGSRTAIPASDMLHIPGVLSQNGITGQGIVKWAASSIGIALATERHAGSFFRNGAISNIYLKTGKVLNKDAADRLRHSWQQTFAGADNHHKALVLEDGMEALPIDMNPEQSQMMLARGFGVTETARWLRLPPHMIADLSRSTNNNIEQQSLEFVLYSLAPWIKRWVKALKRQLLSDEEKTRMFFQFDLSELLKGDSAARAAYMQFKFNTGSASPNDIRAADGENPVEGGDTYFVQGNNYVPLDKMQDLAQANIDKLKAPPPPPPAPPKPPVDPAEEPDDDDGIGKDIKACLDAIRDANASVGELPEMVGGILAAREPAMMEAFSRAAESVNTNTDSIVRGCRDALQIGIEEVLNGMMIYERDQGDRASRAEATAKTFGGWRSGFYVEFSAKLAKKLERFALALRQTKSASFNPDEVAAEWARQSLVSLESVFDADPQERPLKFRAVVGRWSERPKQFASELLKGSNSCAS